MILKGLYGLRITTVHNKRPMSILILKAMFNTNYKYKIGSSFTNDVFKENFDLLKFNRNETTAGVFGEFVYDYKKKFNMIFGSRADLNNYYSGSIHLAFIYVILFTDPPLRAVARTCLAHSQCFCR